MSRWVFRLCLILAVGCSTVGVSRPAFAADDDDALDWEPETTHVFAVGLLQWKDPNMWSSFPAAMKHRRDKQLVDYFRAAGVPKDQIIYLCDAEATKRRIEQEFVKLLDETDDGDLLIFYFCGHGWRDPKTSFTYFANYDAGAKVSSAWDVRTIFSTIEKHFEGDRALLLADCCHSGAL
ncbi:MAG TPA: caspase family protein, partial [Pirellulales bacterium]